MNITKECGMPSAFSLNPHQVITHDLRHALHTLVGRVWRVTHGDQHTFFTCEENADRFIASGCSFTLDYTPTTASGGVLGTREQPTDERMFYGYDAATPKPTEYPLFKSDGSTAEYYELPEGATELQHLISAKNMNAQIGTIFSACFRYGEVAHSDRLRDAKKMVFYAQAEVERLEKYNGTI